MDYRQNPHVKIIKQCAAAVAEGLDPEVVQFKDMQGEWHTANTLECGMPFIGWENFETGNIRIKPRTIVVHGVELPEPLSEAPNEGEVVWLFNPYHEAGDEGGPRWVWTNKQIDVRYLESGLLHSTREAAKQWREFFLSQSRAK